MSPRSLRENSLTATPTSRGFLVLLFLLLLISPLAAAARDAATEEYLQRLPEDTLLYISWRHLDSLAELRATNPLFRFLDSPEMKTNWKHLREYRQRTRSQNESPPEAAQPAKGRDHIPFRTLAPLLENPGFLALVIPHNSPAADSRSPQPTHLYLYDITGMEELLAALEEELGPPGQTRRTYDFDGVTLIETLGSKGAASYQARVGQWLVGGGDRKTVESWIRSVQTAPDRSLKDALAYQHALRVRPKRSQVEIFLNPDPLLHLLKRIPKQENQDSPEDVRELGSSLRLHDWELFFLAAAFERGRTRYDAHAIHSSEAAGLVEVIAPSVSRFPSVEFAPHDASSYSVVTLNLPAIWRSLQGVLQDLPPQAAQLAAGFQGMIEGVLGISLDELVNAWGQEFAQLSYSPPGSRQTGTLRLLQLRDRETILSALRALTAAVDPQVNLEELPAEQEEIAAYFRFGSREPQGKAIPALEPTGNSGVLYIVVAADWLFVGPSKDEIVQALERSRQGPTLTDNPLFQSLRDRFPSNLSTFSFVDVERLLNSEGAKEFLQMLTEQAAAAERAGEASDQTELEPPGPAPSTEAPSQPEDSPPPEPFPSRPPDLEIPTGYLKWWVSGTFRDQQGLHHTGYIE